MYDNEKIQFNVAVMQLDAYLTGSTPLLVEWNANSQREQLDPYIFAEGRWYALTNHETVARIGWLFNEDRLVLQSDIADIRERWRDEVGQVLVKLVEQAFTKLLVALL